MGIHDYDAQTEVRPLIEAHQTVNQLDFCQKVLDRQTSYFLTLHFFTFILNLRALVKHHLPRVTPSESGPYSSEVDDEENIHALSVKGRK